MITHKDRLEACLAGSRTDRTPVALWRHFPVDDQTPQGLASATLAYQAAFDFDLIKVTPASSFCVKDWGVQDNWLGATEGTRDYTLRAIHHPDDWSKLSVLDPTQGFLGGQLTCLKLMFTELGPQTPMLQTIFNPLSQAKNLIGQNQLLVHMRHHPQALHAGLEIITESAIRFIEAAKTTGIAGLFYAVQHAQYSLFSQSEYLEFGKPYDLQVLKASDDLWLNMLHMHGSDIMFDLLVDYPVQILNWHDQETYPSLEQAQRNFSGVVCGGLRRQETMVLGSPQDVQAEAQAALHATNGEKFILGTGCVVPITAPHGNIMAARHSVE